MDEAGFTTSLKNLLEKEDFYFKKLADRTTRGIPDCFIASQKKGMFAEIKLIHLKYEFPEYFTQWSKIITGKSQLQLVTMLDLNKHFLARYLIAYRIENETRIAIIRPQDINNAIAENLPLPILCYPKQFLIQELRRLLQI